MRKPGLLAWERLVWGTIPGKPVAMGRPRIGRNRMFTPKASREYMEEAARIIAGSTDLRITQPVQVYMIFIFPRPKSMPRGYREHLYSWGKTKGRVWKWTKPDIDNLEKMTLDSLVKSGVIQDDSQVVSTHSEKFYAAAGEAAQVKYTINIQRRVYYHEAPDIQAQPVQQHVRQRPKDDIQDD